MSQLSAVCCVLLLVGAATAFPESSAWRRASEPQESHPDRDVEAVEPVRTSGPRGGEQPASDSSDESPEVIPFGIGIGLRGIGGFGGLGGFGGRPVIIRPVAVGPRDSAADEDSDEELPSGSGGFGGGFIHPYFVDPMSNFMSQMAEMMAAMRRQMNQVLHRLPSEGTDFSKLGNTTSTTKVIDGHVITVNETVIGGEDGDDVVHIRVIDVHPSESPDTAAEGGATDSSAPADNGDKKSVADNAEDEDKDVEPLSENSNEVTKRPNRSENEIPMKVGSEVDDLNA